MSILDRCPSCEHPFPAKELDALGFVPVELPSGHTFSRALPYKDWTIHFTGMKMGYSTAAMLGQMLAWNPTTEKYIYTSVPGRSNKVAFYIPGETFAMTPEDWMSLEENFDPTWLSAAVDRLKTFIDSQDA